jgi:hypothetical protein
VIYLIRASYSLILRDIRIFFGGGCLFNSVKTSLFLGFSVSYMLCFIIYVRI